MEKPQSPRLEDPDLCIGRQGAFILKSHRHHTFDRLHTGQPHSRPGIGRPIAFQSPSVHGKDTSKPCELLIGERRWYTIDYSERNSPEPKMISNEFARILRSEPNFHDVDGACLWRLVVQKVRERLPNIDPNVTAEKWLEQLKLGSNRVRLRLAGTRMTTARQHAVALFKVIAQDPLRTLSSSNM